MNPNTHWHKSQIAVICLGYAATFIICPEWKCALPSPFVCFANGQVVVEKW